MPIPARHSILPEYRIAHYSSLIQPHGPNTSVGLFALPPKISYIYPCRSINSTLKGETTRATKFHCSMQKKKESLSTANESVSVAEARKFVDAHSNGILFTLAEICAMTADAAIEDVNGLSGPDRLGAIKDDAQFAYKEYEQPLKVLAIRLANKFATAKVEGWNSTTLMNGNL